MWSTPAVAPLDIFSPLLRNFANGSPPSSSVPSTNNTPIDLTMSATSGHGLQQYNVDYTGVPVDGYPTSLDPGLHGDGFDAYAINTLADASLNSAQLLAAPHNSYAQSRTRSQYAAQPVPRDVTGTGLSGLQRSPTTVNAPTTYNDQAWNINGNSTMMNTRLDQTSLTASGQQQQGQNVLPTLPETPTHKTTNTTSEGGSHFTGMKLVPDPPNLQVWRERLFDVQGTLTLTEDEFQTYFPHIDNVYSHRSTQKYKRKPFVSHYWDCRLKGRPSGTPKSLDPYKKKRKRNTRERDLCDVKIKITEFFGRPGAHESGGILHMPAKKGVTFVMENDNSSNQPYGMLTPSPVPPPDHEPLPPDHPGANGARYFTVQRVSGGNANDEDGNEEHVHKHSLEDSDRIKKNSVQRWLLKEEKDKKRQTVCFPRLGPDVQR